MPESNKQKLTLTVDKETIEKARQAGLDNISEFTEKVLMGFTAAPTEADQAELHNQYERLFSAMLPTLKKYGIDVQVGAETEYDDAEEPIASYAYTFDQHGAFWAEGMEGYSTKIDLSKIPLNDLFEPQRIVKLFIKRIAQAKQENQEKIEQLQMAIKIVEAISDSLSMKAAPRVSARGQVASMVQVTSGPPTGESEK